MKVCTTCGNEIPESATRCPFCESQQSGGPPRPRSRKRQVVEVNLEAGRPTVAEAIANLDMRIAENRATGTRLLRVIHGWGSKGKGGAIKAAVTKHLAGLKRQRRIRDYVTGDEYGELTEAGRNLLSRYPALRSDLRTDRSNPGMTFVEL